LKGVKAEVVAIFILMLSANQTVTVNNELNPNSSKYTPVNTGKLTISLLINIFYCLLHLYCNL